MGAYDTVSAFGHSLLQAARDSQASGGQRGILPPCTPLTRVPLDLAPGAVTFEDRPSTFRLQP